MAAVKHDELITRLRDGNMAALARAISLADSGSEDGRRLHREVGRHSGDARVLGITGAPGAGKSSLINALITALRRADRRVAVVAVDPSSLISGGAVLGDRTRMGIHSADSGVFIRSVSGRGHLGGLSRSTESIIDLLAAAGWPLIILETIGTGQSETEIVNVADVNIVINAPGLGDDIQAVKAGVLEIADILVVNKADLPLAKQTVRDLQVMLQHRRIGALDVPVLETVATEETGISELLATVDAKLATITGEVRRERLRNHIRKTLARQVGETVEQRLMARPDPEIETLCEDVLNGECDSEDAVRQLMGLVL